MTVVLLVLLCMLVVILLVSAFFPWTVEKEASFRKSRSFQPSHLSSHLSSMPPLPRGIASSVPMIIPGTEDKVDRRAVDIVNQNPSIDYIDALNKANQEVIEERRQQQEWAAHDALPECPECEVRKVDPPDYLCRKCRGHG